MYLTNPMNKPELEPRDRPVSQAEIEITPQMLEAGASVLEAWVGVVDSESLVKEIYEQMQKTHLLDSDTEDLDSPVCPAA